MEIENRDEAIGIEKVHMIQSGGLVIGSRICWRRVVDAEPAGLVQRDPN
jgi:hypothetical protein